MEETEFDRRMKAALADMNLALFNYQKFYEAGEDRAVMGHELARAYYALCAVDNGVAKEDSR